MKPRRATPVAFLRGPQDLVEAEAVSLEFASVQPPSDGARLAAEDRDVVLPGTANNRGRTVQSRWRVNP